MLSGPIGTGSCPSGPEQELPSADKDTPASPQPQREQRPPPRRVAHDHADNIAEARNAGDLADV
jgi:hypothetical protein